MQARLAAYYAELGIEPDASAPPPPFDDAMLELVLAERPAVVSFIFGLPAPARLRAVKDAGAIVLSSATTVAEAKWLEAEGADAVIAQGYEAGGHRGTFRSAFGSARIGTMALVPQIVDAVRCPVIAAGGLMDGRGIAAALMLGAAGAQLGTAFFGLPRDAHPSPASPGAQGQHRRERRRRRDGGRRISCRCGPAKARSCCASCRQPRSPRP
jgi:nitronate monooxygenase